MRAGCIAAIAVLTLMAVLLVPPRPRLAWNTTASIPIGLYALGQVAPKRGDLLLIRLPPEVEAWAVSRSILSSKVPVLKPIAALAGDVVCRWGSVVTINGRVGAYTRPSDHRGRALPVWHGCRRLTENQVFVLARHPDSFDSRYFGPVPLALARGVAHPLLIIAK